MEPGREYTVGRAEENDIIITDKNISRIHCKIRINKDRCLISDTGSKNGTFANGMNLSPGVEAEVRECTPIVIGKTILGFGDACELVLGEFLDSAGIESELDGIGEAAGLRRIMGIKNNLEFIYKVTNALMQCKDLKGISKVLLDNITSLLRRIDRCVIILIDESTGKINNIMYRSQKPVEDPNNVYNKELLKHALLIKKPVMIEDSNIMGDEDDVVTESLQLMNIRSAMCVPILGGDVVKGAIYIDSFEKPYGFRKNDAALLKDIGGRTSLAIDNVLMQMSLA